MGDAGLQDAHAWSLRAAVVGERVRAHVRRSAGRAKSDSAVRTEARVALRSRHDFGWEAHLAEPAETKAANGGSAFATTADVPDPDLIPDYHWKADPAWAGKGETLHVKAHYGLLRDNLLDPSHAHHVHRQTLAIDGVIEFPIETDFDGERLRAVRDMRGIAPSPFFSRMAGFTGNVDHR